MQLAQDKRMSGLIWVASSEPDHETGIWCALGSMPLGWEQIMMLEQYNHQSLSHQHDG